ncbi:MAG: hypothetical protein ACREKB_11695 [Candidatus Rokuibacteriota bacterium]
MLLRRVLGEFVPALARHRDGEFCLPEEVGVRTLNTWPLWITVVAGFGGVAVRVVTVRPSAGAKRVGG